MTKLTMEEKQELIRMALAAREKAYVPYSDFMVGAALRAADGRIFTGCNVENAAFTPTSCAERTALFKAVAEGVTAFTDIAVVGSRRGEVNRQITSPCGVCRQALFEFGGPELNVIMAKTPEDFIERSMDELLEKLSQHAAQAGAEYINIYTGEGVSEDDGAKTEALFAQSCPDAEVAAIPGGQSVYFYIISIE